MTNQDMSALYLDILDNNRREIFKKLAAFKKVGVLGGGTAIALQINHRKSFDFDIFLNEPLTKNILSMAHKVLGPGCVQTLNTQDQINLRTPQFVSVTFFYESVSFVYPPLETESLVLADLRDLASNKANVIGYRGKWRDYVDLYFLIKTGKVTLKEVVSLTEKRRGSQFPTRLFLEQLAYFEDIEDYKIDFIGDPVSEIEIKHFLTAEVKKYRNVLHF